MFSGHISNIISNRYPRAIQEALDYIKNTDFDKLEAGRYPIKGDLIYAQVLDLETKDKASFQPEVHRKYLDVQYMHSGQEIMLVATDLGNHKIAQDYDEERDILFYDEVENENQILLLPGRFAVFFPEDTHRSHQFDGKPSQIRKSVVKIALSELEQA